MKWLYVLSLAYSMALAFVYGIGQFNPEFILVFSNILFPTTGGAAVMMSFLILKRYAGHNPKPMFSMAWTTFSSGLFLWFLGELAWAVFILFLQADPFPSVADVFYLSGYVLLSLGSFLILKLFRSVFLKKIVLLQLGVTVGLSCVVSYMMVVPIINSGEEPFTTVLAAAYPILDIVLFALSFAILLVFMKGSIGKAWLYLTLGIVLNIVADLLFTYAELQGFFYEGHPLELFWLWGYVAFFIGFHIHRREL